MMRTASEYFGAEWRSVDATYLDNLETRRDISGEEIRTFSIAVRFLLLSLCRIDDGDGVCRRKYRPLRAGMFRLSDVYAEYLAWMSGKRIYGFAVGCGEMMRRFFEVEAGVHAEVEPSHVDIANRAVLVAILREIYMLVEFPGVSVIAHQRRWTAEVARIAQLAALGLAVLEEKEDMQC